MAWLMRCSTNTVVASCICCWRPRHMALKVSHRLHPTLISMHYSVQLVVPRKSRPHCRKCRIVWLSILLLRCTAALHCCAALLHCCRAIQLGVVVELPGCDGSSGNGALAPQAERTLLYTLGFRLHFDHPHHLVPRLAKDYDVERHFSASSKTPGGHTFTLSQVLPPRTSKRLRVWCCITPFFLSETDVNRQHYWSDRVACCMAEHSKSRNHHLRLSQLLVEFCVKVVQQWLIVPAA